MELYHNGEWELSLSKETEIYLKELQKEFMPEDAKVGIIQIWLDGLAEDYVCSIMVYKEALRHECKPQSPSYAGENSVSRNGEDIN